MKRKDNTSGYVYVLSNPSMNGLIKVGFTTNDPQARARELQTTGVPYPFKVEFVMICDNAREVERNFHNYQSRCRVDGREFFKLSVDEAITDLFAMSGLDMEARQVDLVLDEYDHNKYSNIAGVHPYSLMALLGEIKPNEWKILAERHNVKQKTRLEARANNV